jgi:hypothetical protein
MTRFLALFLILPSLALGAVEIKGVGTTNNAKVNVQGSLRTNEGPSDRATYFATVSGATTTAAWGVTCESGASLGFKVSQYCVTVPAGATAAGGPYVVTLRKTTAASSGGTALTDNGTGATAITRADAASNAFPGVCRGLAQTTTNGATIDQWSFMVNAGVNLQPVTYCRTFGMNGDQLPTAATGTGSGIAVSVAAAGAGALAVGAASMILISE